MNQYSPRYMPLPIVIIEWTEFDNSTLAEKHIFEKLKKYRVKKTEWFYFDNEDCNDIIKKCFDENKIPFDTYDYTIDCNGENIEDGLVSEIEIAQLNDGNSGPQP